MALAEPGRVLSDESLTSGRVAACAIPCFGLPPSYQYSVFTCTVASQVVPTNNPFQPRAYESRYTVANGQFTPPLRGWLLRPPARNTRGTEHLAINNTRTRRLLTSLALRTTAKLYKRRRDPRFRPFKTIQEFHHWLREGFDTAYHSDNPGNPPKTGCQDLKDVISVQNGEWPAPVFTHCDLCPFN